MIPATAARTIGEAQATVLDQSAIERLREIGGDALVRKMIQLFVAGGAERLDRAKAAAAIADCAGVQAVMHSLKSSAGQLGATTLQLACEEGELLASHRLSAALPGVVAALEEKFVAVVRLLKDVTPLSGA